MLSEFEAVKQTGFDLYEKSLSMLEAAVYHSEDAKGTLEKAFSPVKSPTPRTAASPLTEFGSHMTREQPASSRITTSRSQAVLARDYSFAK